MMKQTIFAVLGLAAVLAFANPPRANARVVIGVGVGPVFAPPVVVARPAYGYVAFHPRPYFYARPYAYAPGYGYPRYGYYHRYDGRWDRREFAYRHGYRR